MRPKLGGHAISIGAFALFAAAPVLAAPLEQAHCIHETVPKERLPDFGESALAPEEEKQPDLDPIYNAAENACIGQYGWSEIDAENAGRIFIARVSREYLGRIFTENGVDPAKIDRAYAGVKAQIVPQAEDSEKNRQIIISALQKQAFPVNSQEALDIALTYVGFRFVEDQILADFVAGRKRAD
jgi:hypothetical protein